MDLEKKSLFKRDKKFIKLFLISVPIIACVTAAAIGVNFGIKSIQSHEYTIEVNDYVIPKYEGFLGSYDSPSKLGIYSQEAVATDSAPCAKIGRDILQMDGNAFDSVIAVLLCMGVTIPESMGLGGGSLITLYDAAKKEAVVIDARESAPLAAHADMYDKNGTLPKYGPMAIAVPGELHGYWYLHKTYGKLEWSKLFDGAIKLASEGFPVHEHLYNSLNQTKKIIEDHKALRDAYMNHDTNELYKIGEIFVQKTLSETLKRIAQADDPIQLFYSGEIAENIIKDIEEQKHEYPENSRIIITKDDFASYKLITNRSVVETDLKRANLKLFTFPLPGSGHLLAFIMRVMEKYDDLYPEAKMTLNGTVKFYHRLMETFKYAYSRRMLLGDDGSYGQFDDVTDVIGNLTNEEYIENIRNRIDDSTTFNDSEHYGDKCTAVRSHGTSHASVVDKYGNAVAVSATINAYFGSKVYSPRTGIILNNEMDDFSVPGVTNDYGVPPSDFNLINATKRPLSSMCPAIFVDRDTNAIRLVIGGAGGTKITTSTAFVAIRNLWFEESIKTSIDAPRIHHQLCPNEVVYEENFPNDIIKELENLGHITKSLGGQRAAIMVAVSGNGNILMANSDYRKGGDVNGI